MNKIILCMAMITFQNITCSIDKDLGWNPIKDNSQLYGAFLDNVAQGLDEACQAYVQSLSIDVVPADYQRDLLLLNISPAVSFDSGQATQDSCLSSVLSDENDSYDTLALIFGCDELVAQKIKKVKSKKKKNDARSACAACLVVQQAQSPEMMRKVVQDLMKEDQRQQAIARKEVELACKKAEQDAKKLAQQVQRQRQIEMSQQKKAIDTAAKASAQKVKDAEAEYLDGLIRAENARKEAIEQAARQQQAYRDAYHQRKNNPACMAHNSRVQMLEKGAQDMVVFIKTLEISEADMKQLLDVFSEEQNLRLDIVCRENFSSMNESQGFYLDLDFFLDAFVTLKKMIDVDALLFARLNKVKKYQKSSVLRFVLNTFEDYVSKEAAITPKMYDLLYSLYEVEFDFIKTAKDQRIDVGGMEVDVDKIESILEIMESALKQNNQWRMI